MDEGLIEYLEKSVQLQRLNRIYIDYTENRQSIKEEINVICDARNKLKDYLCPIREISSNMSRLQILAYMYEHPFMKVRHELFDDDEWLYYDFGHNCIRDENGYWFEDWDSHDGMRIRNNGQWLTGWTIIEDGGVKHESTATIKRPKQSSALQGFRK